MRKLSQKELLQEGFASLLKDVGKSLVKKAMPKTATALSGAKGLYKKHFNNASKTVESFVKSKPEVFGDINNIKEKELQRGVYEVNFTTPVRNIKAGTESKPVSIQAKVVEGDKGFRIIDVVAAPDTPADVIKILKGLKFKEDQPSKPQQKVDKKEPLKRPRRYR